VLNWTVVAGAAGSAVMLVGIVLIWIATHPDKRGRAATTRSEPVAVAPIETPVAPIVAPEFIDVDNLKEKEPIPALTTPAVEVAVRPARAPAPGPAAVEPEPVRGPFQVAAVADAASVCSTLGTAVEFDANPARAGQRAAKDGKLMMILHVSGNFEDAGFT
jgi:hypothetical protein